MYVIVRVLLGANADELHVMLMNLLMDRLQLKFHHEKKDMAMYALTVENGGPQLTPHEAADAGEPGSLSRKASCTWK